MQRQQSDEAIEQSADDVAPDFAPPSSPESTIEAGDLRSVERLIAVLERQPEDPFKLPRRERAAQFAPEPPNAPSPWTLQPLPNAPAEQRGGLLVWLFLSLGLMAFVCGGVMLVWSVVAAREELWSLGIPLALGGQGAIIFGLIGLAETASQRLKQTTAALDEHRQRLALLQNLSLAGQMPQRRAA